jgi:hypothetical protein
MTLPSFAVTGNLFDIPGQNDGSHLLTTGLKARVEFTPNVTGPVKWEDANYWIKPVGVTVSSDGSLSDVDAPILLLANDAGLNVSGIQWTAHILIPGAKSIDVTFNAPGDGQSVDLAAVTPAPAAPVDGDVPDIPDWNDLGGKPAVIAAGATQALARTAIGAVAAADITTAVNAVINGAPGALDTLNELAAALGDDANFATTVTNALAGKAQGLTATAVKTANYTAAVGDLVLVDASSGAITITAPTAPADKSRIGVKLISVSVLNAGFAATLTRGGSTDVFNKASGSTSLTLDDQNQVMICQYIAATGVWVVEDNPSRASLDARYLPGNLKVNFAGKANSSSVPKLFDTLQPLSELVGVGTNSQGIVNNGAYTFAPTNSSGSAADYLRFQLPANITRGRLTYQLAGAGGVCMAFGKQAIAAGQVPDLSQHLSMGSTNFSLGYWDGPTGGNTGFHSLNTTSWTTYGQAPTLDGFTTYTVETVHVGSKIYIFLPDGSSIWVTNAAVSGNAGPYGFIECFNNVGTDAPARIVSFEAWTGVQPVPLNRPWVLSRRAVTTTTTTLTASTPTNPAGIVSNTFLAPATGAIKCTMSVFFNVVTAGNIFMGCIPYATGSSRFGGAYYDQVQSTSGVQMRTVVQILTGLTPGQWYTVLPEVMSTASDTQYLINTAQGKYHSLTVEPYLGAA